MHRNVSALRDSRLCTGCGGCESICPNSCIKIKEHKDGYFLPYIEEEDCSFCGFCYRICPGVQNLQSFGDLPEAIIGIYLTKSRNLDLYKNGQSGGVVTSFLKFLLEQGKVSKELVTKAEGLSVGSFWTTNVEDLKTCQGSIYWPNPLCRHIDKKETKDACIVGLPCQIAAVRNMFSGKEHPLMLGLFCSGVLSKRVLDAIVSKYKDAISYKCRVKGVGGEDDVFKLIRKDNNCLELSSIKDVFKMKGLFLQPSCSICNDQLNKFSDISFGDAWGFEQGSERFTVVIVRSPRGKVLWEEFQSSNNVESVEIDDYQKVLIGQNIHYKIGQSQTAASVLKGRINQIITGGKRNLISIDFKNIKISLKVQILCISKDSLFFRILTKLYKRKAKINW